MAALARAAGAIDRAARNPDVLARRLLAARYRVALLPGLRGVLRLGYEWLCPGLYMFIQARTHVVDRELARRARSGELEQLVILGAGLDSRAYRLQLERVQIFEVDFPATARGKRAALARAGLHGDHVRYVAIDFTSETLAQRLPAEGFDPARRTLFVWEGVTMYLPEAAVAQTLGFVATCAPGSAIVFDYFYRDAVDHPERFHGAVGTLAFMNRRGEPCMFGVNAADLPAFVGRCGLALAADHGPEELGKLVTLGRTRTIIDFSAIAVAERR